MFGRKLKYHEPEIIDVDTLPESRNVRQAGTTIEAKQLLHAETLKLCQVDRCKPSKRNIVGYST